MSSARANRHAEGWLTRPEIVSALFVVGFINGITETAFKSVQMVGLGAAVCSAFGINVFVLVCAYLCLQSVHKARSEPPSRSDIIFFLSLIPLYAVPIPLVTWVALTALAVREYFLSDRSSARRRAAILMFGLTIPMCWSRLIFTLLSGWILKLDAIFVSLVVRSPYHDNVVMLPHQAGYVYISSTCSSLANMSMAMLCWLMFTEYSGRSRNSGDYLTCGLVCASVVVLNVARISCIALRPDLYGVIHGPFGATIFGYFETFVVIAICFLGVQRENKVVSAFKDRGGRNSGDFSCGAQA